jgi:hypothetical protein
MALLPKRLSYAGASLRDLMQPCRTLPTLALQTAAWGFIGPAGGLRARLDYVDDRLVFAVLQIGIALRQQPREAMWFVLPGSREPPHRRKECREP